VTLLRPSGTALSTASIGAGGGFVDAVSLPADGSYTVVADPSGAPVGTVTLRLYDVPADSTATGVLGGAGSTVSTAVPGQNAVLSFSSTAGRRTSIRVAGSGLPTTRFDLRQPNGSLVTTFYVSTGGGFMDARSLPTAGDYTLSIDPSGGSTVTMTVTLFDVPPDAAATTVPGGSPTSLAIAVPGQNGSVGFPAAAGQRISLQVAMSMSARLVLLAPDGSTVRSVVVGGTTFVDVTVMPVAGGYTLVIDPIDANTGQVTVTVNDVPADIAGTITTGGPPLTVSMPVPGEGGSIAFDSTAGRALKLNLTGVTVSIMRVSVVRADGAVVVPATFMFSGSKTFAFTAPVTGGYRIVLDPYEAATGAATLGLS
jgi:hypothetical protein